MPFTNEVTAGDILVRQSIQSPDYVPGASGWMVGKDGTAEFNSLNIRGTFNGNDYVLNADGLFMYQGAAGVGNLTVSISPTSGTDTYGNQFLQGLVSYDCEGTPLAPVSYIQNIQGEVIIGSVTNGVFQIGDETAQLVALNNITVLNSPVDPGNPTTTADNAYLVLMSGEGAQASGGTNTPRAVLADFAGTSPADLLVSGTLIQTDVSGTPLKWQTPSLGSGWSTSAIRSANPLKYRIENGNLVLQGSVNCTSTAPAATIFTVVAPYIPAAAWNLQQAAAIQQSSAGSYKAMGHMFISGGNIEVNGFTFASGDILSFNHSFPLGIIP